MPPQGQAATGATSSTSSGTSNSNTGASPSSGSGSTTAKSVNIGMGPQKSAPSTSQTHDSGDQGGRLSDDQLFSDYGEAIFKHPRFKELTDNKRKFEPLEPLLNSWQDPNSLLQFEEYLGPIWKAMNSKGPEMANKYWGGLLPVFQAIINGQDISPLLAKALAQENANGNSAQVVDENPLAKDVNALKNEVNQFKTDKQQREAAEQRQRVERHQTANLEKYETSFNGWADTDKIPQDKDTRKRLGDIMAANMYKYMPKASVRNRQGQLVEVPQNALMNHNEEALRKCYEGEVLPFYRSLKGEITNGVIHKVEGSGPAIPNTNNQGVSVTGGVNPITRKEKANRLAQYLGGAR